MNGRRFSEDKARRGGFYLALAVCFVAVGIAAWSTYDAVNTYTKPKEAAITADRDDPEAPAATPRPSVVPKVTPAPRATTAPKKSTAKQTAGTVAAAPTMAPAPTEDVQTDVLPIEEQIPANAPLYERSSQMISPLGTEELFKAYSAGAPVYSETMKDWRVHTGMDQAAQPNEEVKACANGMVKQTYSDSMWGNVIVIEHGDYEFSYCGVSEDFRVSAGDIVTKGQVIGTVTAIPCESADPAHLHISVQRDGVYLDPAGVIGGNG